MIRSILFLSLFIPMLSLQAADVAKGKKHYQMCAACHGDDGAGIKLLGAPRLAGQESWYVKLQLTKFQKGIRGADKKDIFGRQMAAMAKILPDEQALDDVVAYVATLKSDAGHDKIVGGDATKGAASYATCVACHGDKGQGMEVLKAPRLKDQHGWYALRQLANFKSGIRGAHPSDAEGALMRPMAMILADEQAMKDVIAYIDSMK